MVLKSGYRNQLRLVGSLSRYLRRVNYTSQVVVWDFWSINSMLGCEGMQLIAFLPFDWRRWWGKYGNTYIYTENLNAKMFMCSMFFNFGEIESNLANDWKKREINTSWTTIDDEIILAGVLRSLFKPWESLGFLFIWVFPKIGVDPRNHPL